MIHDPTPHEDDSTLEYQLDLGDQMLANSEGQYSVDFGDDELFTACRNEESGSGRPKRGPATFHGGGSIRGDLHSSRKHPAESTEVTV